MTKAKLILALAATLASLHATASFAAEAPKAAPVAPEASTVAPEQKPADDSTLFTRVNGAYRKSAKQLLPQT